MSTTVFNNIQDALERLDQKIEETNDKNKLKLLMKLTIALHDMINGITPSDEIINIVNNINKGETCTS
jgi:hypothetical protein